MNGFELSWGIPVIGYLFLAGVGAGALTTSASMLLRGGQSERYFHIARYGAFLATPIVVIGTGLLVLDLGSFQTGHWFKFINLFKIINLSPMSIGTWLLVFFILIGVPYGYTFLSKDAAPGDRFDPLRRLLAWISVPLGLAVAVYTGVLLGAMPARPFWNSPIIAMLFLLSSLSTGMAALILVDVLWNITNGQSEALQSELKEANYILSTTDTIFISLELLVIFLFIMYAHLTVGDPREAIKVIQWGGELAMTFWFWVVFVGLLLPGAIQLYDVMPRILATKSEEALPMRLLPAMHLAVASIVLLGGFMLRYVVVVAGQITGPIGL
jgi:formate-dependent nitrite reductase membrane component NrfD